MTLTKANLCNMITDQIGVSKNEALKMVEVFFEEISDTLVDGEEVKLANFGVFDVREKAQRMGRNPKTLEEKVISARRVVSFYPSKSFRDAVETNFMGENA